MQNNHIKTDFIEFLTIGRSDWGIFVHSSIRTKNSSQEKSLLRSFFFWSCYPSKIGRSSDGNIQISQEGKKKKKKQQFFQQQYKNVRGKEESMKF